MLLEGPKMESCIENVLSRRCERIKQDQTFGGLSRGESVSGRGVVGWCTDAPRRFNGKKWTACCTTIIINQETICQQRR
jgi:hypothetical protein